MEQQQQQQQRRRRRQQLVPLCAAATTPSFARVDSFLFSRRKAQRHPGLAWQRVKLRQNEDSAGEHSVAITLSCSSSQNTTSQSVTAVTVCLLYTSRRG